MSSKNNVQSQFRKAFKNKIKAFPHDVTFLVGVDQKKISCHKLILSIASPVFEKIFSDKYNHTIRRDNNGHYEIHEPDLDFIAMKNFIRCAYTGNTNVTGEKNALSTIFAADKYYVPDLFKNCTDVLKKGLNIERNAVRIYQVAHLLNLKDLYDETRFCISEQFSKLAQTEQFLEFSEEDLLRFLKMQNLKVDSEVQLFKAVLRWARNQCEIKGFDANSKNCRVILNNILRLIRFPLMDPKEFKSVIEPSGILKRKEYNDLQNFFSSWTLCNGFLVPMKLNYSCEKREHVNIFDAKFALPLKNFFPDVSRPPFDNPDRFRVSGNVPETLRIESIGVFLGGITNTEITIAMFYWDLTEGRVTLNQSGRVLIKATKMVTTPNDFGLHILHIHELLHNIPIRPDRIYGVRITKIGRKYKRDPVELLGRSPSMDFPILRGKVNEPDIKTCKGIQRVCTNKSFSVFLDWEDSTTYSIRFRY